ncbi:hypothetical protein ACFX15_039697 [Malus domestica]
MISIHIARLEQLQNKWEDHIEEIRNLTVTIDKLEEKNELFSRQRSRVKWLREGDSNSHFFPSNDHTTSAGGRREWGSVIDCVQPIVSETMNVHLTRPMSLEEVKDAVFQMGGLKAPGPDDLQGIFYHSYGDIILEDRMLMG